MALPRSDLNPRTLGPLALLCFWFAASPLRAGSDRWSSIGPDGGSVTTLAVDPVNPATLFAGTERGGIFKSVDRGASWRPANDGIVALPPFNRFGRVNVLALDPVHPSTIYASITGVGVIQSVNGGATWSFLLLNPSFPDPGIASIAISPSAPEIVYAGGYVSRDAGATWTRGIVTQFGLQSLAVDPKNAGVAYLAMPAQGSFQTSDAGETWVALTNAPPDAKAVAVDPFESSRLYLGTTTGRQYRSDDRGQTWTFEFVLRDSPNVFQIVPDSNVPGRLYATTAAGFFRTSDFGSTWTPIVALSGLAPFAFAPDPTAPAILYAGTSGGALRSTDGGVSWGIANEGLSALPVSALATDSRLRSVIWAGIDAIPAAVARSDDGGGSWSVSPLPGATGVLSIATDAGNPNVVYAAAPNAVFRSDDGGVHWATSTGLPAGPVPFLSNSNRAFAADPRDAQTIYVGTGGGRGLMGSISVSRDAGRTWTDAHPSVPFGSVLALAADAASRGTVWAATIQGTWRSQDSGTTWSLLGPQPRFFASYLAVDPGSPTTLFASGSPNNQETGVWRSIDSGASWSRIDLGRGAGGGPIAVDQASHTLLVGGTGTVSRTSDSGATWIQLSHGLEPRPIKAVAFAADSTTVYSALDGRGVFADSLSPSRSQCVAGSTTLCLHGSRFEARVSFHSRDGLSGDGLAVPAASGDTGAFWFFSNRNLELLVKVVDGRAVNGNFWIFSGALSNVAYTLTVRDAETGMVRSYENPEGRIASIADTSAFPSSGESIGSSPSSEIEPGTEGPSPCGGGSATAPVLCLGGGGRFRVEARWTISGGPSGSGAPVPLTGDTGAVWFFSPNNLELLVKVVDGRPVNGKFWFFVGALTNVGYSLVVTDTRTGNVRRYDNPPGTLASFADTDAF
ncbi:MAG: hypothetical protein M3167_09580 [Acidobacteriota bacterium]|nr:hypothetical protein [Acidobacteriota bacterium]